MNNNELKIIIPVVLGTLTLCLLMCAAVAVAKSRRTIYRTEQVESFTEDVEGVPSSNNSWFRSPLSSPRSQRYIQIPMPVAASETRAEAAAVNDPPPAYQQSQHDIRVQASPA